MHARFTYDERRALINQAVTSLQRELERKGYDAVAEPYCVDGERDISGLVVKSREGEIKDAGQIIDLAAKEIAYMLRKPHAAITHDIDFVNRKITIYER